MDHEWLFMKFHGRPHQGPVYDRMKLTRARFKYAQRSVEKNTLRAETLGSKLDTNHFRTGSTPLSNKVGETSGPDCIKGFKFMFEPNI